MRTIYNKNNVVLCFILLFSIKASAFGTDPVSSYLTKGQPVEQWTMSIGNGLNWFIPVEKQKAKTPRGNLTISPSSNLQDGDAIKAKWKGKIVKTQWGGNALYDTFLTLGKHSIDLSTVKDAAALVVQLKVNRKPTSNVKVSMQCDNNNECKGEYELKNVLKKLPKGEWTNLPIPLNCFDKEGTFNYSNISTVFSIATQGKLELEIANIGLSALPQGSKGCVS